jgi:chromosome segregation ATPase
MSKLVPFLGRKASQPSERPVSAAAPAKATGPVVAPAQPAVPEKTDIELDQDLFLPVAIQLGKENEAVRNLLMDAEYKLGELETIRNSIGKLVDPVAKTLRAYEETKSEKLSLQNTLNTVRVTQSKLRDDLLATERKARTLEAECTRLRDVLAMAQQSVAVHEKTKAEQLAELSARRSQIAELQRHVHQQAVDLQQAREENRRAAERIAAADRRAVQFENEAQTAQQKALQASQERLAVQTALDKAHTELAQAARRLTDTDRALGTAQSRLQTVEAALAEAQGERTRLATALDEINHKHFDEMNMQTSRFEALQARAGLTERLLEEARETLLARADEIRTFERRVIEASTAHDNAGERLARMAEALAEREARIAELEQSQAALQAHNEMLNDASLTRDSAYSHAEQKIREQADLIVLLENQVKASRSAHELQIEQLNAQLQREQLERSMAEGALESGRRDIARLLREIGAMQAPGSGLRAA